jgi:hypothetical protein
MEKQAPNPDNGVLLARETDRYGMPRLKIDWLASELDWFTLFEDAERGEVRLDGCLRVDGI